MDDGLRNHLRGSAYDGNWREVVNIYTNTPSAHILRLNRAGATALHIAVSERREDVVESLVEQLVREEHHPDDVSQGSAPALIMKDKRGNTPLHLAAAVGSDSMCRRITATDSRLAGISNKDGFNPIHVAVLGGRSKAFKSLIGSPEFRSDYAYARMKNGDTILHSAIRNEYQDFFVEDVEPPAFDAAKNMWGDLQVKCSACFQTIKRIIPTESSNQPQGDAEIPVEGQNIFSSDTGPQQKLPWPNTRSKANDFHADDAVYGGGDEESCTSSTTKKSQTERSSKRHGDRVRRCRIDPDASQVTDLLNYRIFVGTWNVGGKSPPTYLGLEDWIHASPAADIYVIGFQEIVPLNAGNVLGTEDDGPARKWLALIRRTLNSLPGTSYDSQPPSQIPEKVDFKGSTSMRQNAALSVFWRPSCQSLSRSMRVDSNVSTVLQPTGLERRFSVCDYDIFAHTPTDFYPTLKYGYYWDDDENVPCDSTVSYNGGSVSMEDRRNRQLGQQFRYCLVASKQMVGIFLTVWIRSDMRDGVTDMKVSCVGRGLMGCLGNKGSISISMSLHQTSFCFVCSHLISGQKVGDELRRNSDVTEILRKTRFLRVHGVADHESSPQTILDHDRIIWLGDLNYRIALSYGCAKPLVEMRNWGELLQNDQLRMEQRQGRVFEGWNEGRIHFPPTYKYSTNSDRYSGEATRPKEKRRTPAWCDRILWHGRGLHQLSYVRGETRFSDHKPVYGIFLAEVESTNRSWIRKGLSCSGSRVEIEELLPHSHAYNELNLY